MDEEPWKGHSSSWAAPGLDTQVWLVWLPKPDSAQTWQGFESHPAKLAGILGYWLKIKTSCQKGSASHSHCSSERGFLGCALTNQLHVQHTRVAAPAKQTPVPDLMYYGSAELLPSLESGA